MIGKYRLRRLLAPTRKLQWALVLFVAGQAALLVGLGLTFRNFIRPMLASLASATDSAVRTVVPAEQVAVTEHVLGGLMIVVGFALSVQAIGRGVTHVVETLVPERRSGKMDAYFRRLELAQGPRIVAIGGGTGLSTMLRGLKKYSSNITAIVTVTDDGGSSGRLMREKGIIPPGDLRNCLVALADAEKAMTDLFQHRFRDESGSLSGHAIGNLLIAALADQANGDFEKAIDIASRVLNIRGSVVPSTLDQVQLSAEFDDGEIVVGETEVASRGKPIRRMSLVPEAPVPHPGALEAIRHADIIIVGPGSVYTSVVPNLLVPGIAEAIVAATARKVYICNVMTQPGESEGFSASEHVRAITHVIPSRVFDYVLVNTAIPNQELIQRYSASKQHLVDADVDQIRKLGFRPLPGDYMNDTDYVRHDPSKVSQRLMKLLET
ncbi:MAG: gluconeogenesis factor YvcK family protein [Fimbriimonadaceae bacterium]|nr:gluconeogenesis factor YvcK family protein [Fimbriimonadaceae bacterium]